MRTPILPNVPSWRCAEPQGAASTCSRNLDSLVVKPADGSGGYGMLMGPMSTQRERAQFAAQLKAAPRNFIAQPVITLSTVPTFVGDRLEPRHVDLRPFILSGPSHLRDHRRPDARRAAQGLAGGQLLAGRRQQGHLDRGYGGLSMLSRVAENIYWLARYLERAENTARLISVNANLLLDLQRGYEPGWLPLIDITGSRERLR